MCPGSGWKLETIQLLRYSVVGRDNPAPFQKSISEGDLSGQVRFLPPRADVEFYYAAADAYVSPTLEDSFGLPPAEAMASGLPVVTSRLAGVSEIMTPGVDSFVLEDPEDFAALAEVLLRLKSDSVLRERIATAAVETASKLTWDDAAEHLRASWEAARAAKSDGLAKMIVGLFTEMLAVGGVQRAGRHVAAVAANLYGCQRRLLPFSQPEPSERIAHGSSRFERVCHLQAIPGTSLNF